MKNINRGFVGIVIGIILALLMGVGAYVLYSRTKADAPAVAQITLPQAEVNPEQQSNQNVQESPKEETKASGSCGLIVDSPRANAKVSFPLTITGRVDNTNAATLGCGWFKFEGEAGSVQLSHNYGNNGWKPVGAAIPVQLADNWMSATTTFEVSISFNNGGMGLPPDTPMKLVFTESNAKDGEINDTFELPIVFLNSAANNGI
jgi:hypothetical protein